MTKFLTLLAAVGLLSAPAFAEEKVTAPAVNTIVAVDCTKAADKPKCEADAKIAAKESADKATKEMAPAAGKVEEKKAH